MEFSYSDCLEMIKTEELYEGLLGYGLFTEKLPPIFTSVAFFDYCQSEQIIFPKKLKSTYIYYESIKYTNAPRVLGIPNPAVYQKLCRCLADNWDKLKKHFEENTKNQKYKVSRIHIRKITGRKALFEMNYKNFKIDGDPEPSLLFGARYMVYADISNCFPSTYSHAISWALVGKEEAKINQDDHNKWYNKIDFNVRNMKDGETQGFLVGPHTSNLLSEIILTSIDKNLLNKGWNYTRNIDDYTCFVDNYKEAREFIIDLSEELRHYGLMLNHKKTEIKQLPVATVERWVRKLNSFVLVNQSTMLKFNEVRAYLDTAIELLEKNNENIAILNYAIKVLASKKMTDNAKKYFAQTVFHLVLIYPYLIQLLETYIFDNLKISKNDILSLSQKIFNLGLATKNYEATSYSIYFALKYNFLIEGLAYESVEKSNHCVFILLAYLHEMKIKNRREVKKYKALAKSMSSNEETFNCFWLFVYEVLGVNDLRTYWKPMKRKGVTFVKII